MLGITNCLKLIPVEYLIVLQAIVLLPLALVRDLAKLSTPVLIADAFILAGLIYIFGSEFAILAKNGIADVKWFNPKDFSLFIGYVRSGIFYLILPKPTLLKDGSVFFRGHWLGMLCFNISQPKKRTIYWMLGDPDHRLDEGTS